MVDPLYFLGRTDPKENTIFRVAEIYSPVDVRRVERQHTEAHHFNTTRMHSRALSNTIEAGYKANRSVLIVAKPGRIRDSLEALLRTIPQVKIAGQADDGSTAREMITEDSPDLILLVTNLADEGTGQILEHVKDVPRTQCLVLTNTILHMVQAEAAGADEVLLIGFPTHRLFETVTRLLSVCDEERNTR